MADGDKITIDQINWDDSNLPKWASADTQDKIKKILEKSLKEQEDQSKKDVQQLKTLKTITDKIQEQFDASSRSSKSMLKALDDQSGENQASTKLITDNQVKQISALNSISGLIQKQIDSTSASLSSVADNQDGGVQDKQLASLNAIAQAVQQRIDDNSNTAQNVNVTVDNNNDNTAQNVNVAVDNNNDNNEQVDVLENIQKTISEQNTATNQSDLDKETIKDLTRVIQKLIDSLGKKAGSSSGDGSQEKVMAMMKAVKADPRSLNLAKKSLKEQQEQTDEAASATEAIDKILDTNSKGFKELYKQYSQKAGDQAEKMAKANVKTPFAAVNKKIAGFAKKLGFAGLAIGAFATAFGFVIGRLKQFSDAFRQVFSMGFRFEQGSMGIAKAAVAAEMGIQEYTEILGKYSTSIGILGTQSFSDLNVAIRDNLQAQGMLGMGLAELTEYTADYVDQLRTTGILSGQNNEDLEAMAENYLKNITAFTQLANVSRDQINAIIKSSTEIDAFTNKLNTLPATLQRNVLAAAQTVAGMFGGLGNEFGDQLATTFTQAYGRGGLFFTEAGRELLAVNKRLYNSLDGVITNMESMSDQEAAEATANLIDEIANTSKAERERLGVIERSNTEYAGAARQQIALINKVQQLEEEGKIEIYKDLQKLRQESNVDKLSVAFLNFERMMQKLKVTFNTFFTELFGDEKIFNAVSSALESISGKLVGFADKIKELAGRFGDFLAKAINYIGQLFDSTKKGAGGLFASIFGPLKTILTQGIAAGINRGLAVSIAGGVNAEDLQGYDKMLEAINSSNSTQEQKDKALQELAFTTTSLNEALKFQKARKSGNPTQLAEAREIIKASIDSEIGKFYGNPMFKQNVESGTGTDGGNNTEPAAGTNMFDPAQLSETKLRISKQYLPMSGSSDPSMTAEADYQTTSLQLLTEIAKHTSGTAKSAKEIPNKL